MIDNISSEKKIEPLQVLKPLQVSITATDKFIQIAAIFEDGSIRTFDRYNGWQKLLSVYKEKS